MRNDRLPEARRFLEDLTTRNQAKPRFLAAVSGGLDSMCLLRFLLDWQAEKGGAVLAAHFNHRLRGEDADRDEAFVRDWCWEHGVTFIRGEGDARAHARQEGQSIEEAARHLRYGFLLQAAEENDCDWVLTAHQADDSAETLLLNLVRGTGIRGLCGIPDIRGKLARPFLHVTRRELEEYAAARNIPHREDATNADPDAASRNFLRLRVMPLLKELNPQAVEHLQRTAGQLRTIDASLERDAAGRIAQVEAQEGRVTLLVDTLFAAPEAVRPRMLLLLFDRLGVGRRDIGAAHINAILSMVPHTEQGKESRLSLPQGVTARYCRRWLILETRPQPLAEVQLIPGQPLRWGDYTLTLLDRPNGEGLALRARKPHENWAVSAAPCVPGERLTLPGARGGRSIKRLCLDRRISLEERDRLPAIYIDGRLAAVWRLGVDTAFWPEGQDMPCRFVQIKKEKIEEGGNDEK